MAAPVISSVAFNPTSGWKKIGDTIDLVITADGTGYTEGTITINGHSATGFTDNADNTYTVTYTVVEGDTDRLTTIPISVTLFNGAEESTAFTTSPAAGSTPEVDANKPVISATSPATSAYIKAGFTVGYTISEDVASGTIVFTRTSGSADADSPQTYNLAGADLTAGAVVKTEAEIATGTGAALKDGTVYSIAFSVTDAAGNVSTTVTNTSVTYDTTAPTCTLTESVPETIGSDPFEVTATFSEDVTGFVIGDLTLTNCSASNFAGSNDVYTFDITPTATGTITIQVGATKCVDLAGNANTASNTLSITADISGVDSVVVDSGSTLISGKVRTFQSILTSRVVECPVTVTYSADQNYTTDGNTVDLSLEGRISTIISVIPQSNDKGVILEYVPAAGNAAATGKIRCRGIDTDAVGGSVAGFPELADTSTAVNSMVAKFLVTGY